jgi:rhamnulokinase
MPHYLAIDLGASSGRAILGHLDGDRIELEETHRFETPVLEEDGHFYWDLDRLTEEVKVGFSKGLEIQPTLRSVSVDSWSVDYVPLDELGKPLRNPYCYRDARTDGMIEKAFESISRQDLYALAGIQYMPFNTLFQLLADVEFEPELFSKKRNRLLIADYFNYVLGGRSVIDLSNASSTHMIDAKSQDWSPKIVQTFGIDSSTLPEIVPSGTVIGTRADSVLVSVIASCSHDTGAAVAAVPADDTTDNWCYLSLGTWALIGIESETPILTEKALEAGFTNEVGLGGRIRFLKNLVGMWPLQECMRQWNESGTVTYDMIIREASQAAQQDRFIDLSDPRFMAPGDMERRLLSYCDEVGILRPTNRGTFVRLILASIVNSMKGAVAELESVIGRTIHTIHIVGGGSQNHLLCQMAANATQRRITAGPVEATALGNVLIQAQTMGDLGDGVTIRDVVRNSFDVTEFEPSPIH